MTTLPFMQTGALIEQGGAAVAGAGAIPCSVWPAVGVSNSATGRHHDHRGEADRDHAAALQVPNRSLVVDGITYKVVAATPMDLVPHVVLELLRTSGRS